MKDADSLYTKVFAELDGRNSSYSKEDQDTEHLISAKVIRPIAFYVRDHYGRESLDSICQDEIDSVELLKGSGWITYNDMESFFEKTLSLFQGNEEEFKKASIYRLTDAIGAMRYLVMAKTVKSLYLQSARTRGAASSITSSVKFIAEGTNWLKQECVSKVPLSNLVIIHLSAFLSAMPTLWGLPSGNVTIEEIDEKTYIFSYKWSAASREFLYSLSGSLIGAILIGIIYLLTGEAIGPWWLLLVIGALGGYMVSLRQKYNATLEFHTSRINTISQEEAKLMPIIGILKHMGVVQDSDLDDIFSKGVICGSHLLDLLKYRGVVTDDDLKKAEALHQRVKSGNGRALDALFDIMHSNVDRRHEVRQNGTTAVPEEVLL